MNQVNKLVPDQLVDATDKALDDSPARCHFCKRPIDLETDYHHDPDYNLYHVECHDKALEELSDHQDALQSQERAWRS